MAKVFVSYSRKNNELAQSVAKGLSQKSHEVFIDTNFIKVGMPFRKAISERIYVSDGFVVLITKESRASDNVIGEIGAARLMYDKELLIIIALVNDGLEPPGIIEGLQWKAMLADNLDQLVNDAHEAIVEFIPRKKKILEERLNAPVVANQIHEILKGTISRYNKWQLLIVGLFVATLCTLGSVWTFDFMQERAMPIYIFCFLFIGLLAFLFTRVSNCMEYCTLAQLKSLTDVPSGLEILKRSPCLKKITELH